MGRILDIYLALQTNLRCGSYIPPMLPIFMHAKCFMQLVHEQVISNLAIIINGKNFIVDNTDS